MHRHIWVLVKNHVDPTKNRAYCKECFSRLLPRENKSALIISSIKMLEKIEERKQIKANNV